jgi:hypothetical protein
MEQGGVHLAWFGRPLCQASGDVMDLAAEFAINPNQQVPAGHTIVAWTLIDQVTCTTCRNSYAEAAARVAARKA